MIQNKVVALTGACGRIGASFAQAIVNNGGKVLLGDIDIAKGAGLVEQLGVDNAFFVELDVSDKKSIQHFLDEGVKRFSKIDAAVHSAYPRSAQWGKPFEELAEKGLEEDLFGQLGGAILFSQAVVGYFKNVGGGQLVHISSIQGTSAPKFHHYEGTAMVSPIEYSAIKAGIIAVTRYLAKYCKGNNIRVNCISPVCILDKQPGSFISRYKADCLNKGLLDADDISGALIFLLSEQSNFINGQNIIVDDGWSL
jgi:NAD(P)-dependent dehydrogenase (short-subunit alcohol dehydrogenase family)